MKTKKYTHAELIAQACREEREVCAVVAAEAMSRYVKGSLERLTQVVAAEREACAKVADKITKELTDYGTPSHLAKSAGWKIADAIRARSEQQ